MRNYLIMELSAIEATWVMPCYLLGKHFLAFVDVDLLVTDFFFFFYKNGDVCMCVHMRDCALCFLNKFFFFKKVTILQSWVTQFLSFIYQN